MAEEREDEVMSEEEERQAREEIAKEEFGDEYTPSPDVHLKEEPPESKKEEPPKSDEGIKKDDAGDDSAVVKQLKEMQSTFDSKLGALDKYEERLKQAESRIGGITNRMRDEDSARQTAEEEAQKLEREGKLAPSQEEIDAAAGSDVAWEELKVDYPEWTTALDKRFAAERVQTSEKLKAIEQIRTELLEVITPLQARIEEISKGVPADVGDELPDYVEQLMSIHYPDWKDTIKSNEWKEWLPKQSDEIKLKSSSSDVSDALEVLDLFSTREGGGKTPAEIAKERKERLKKSTLPESKGKKKEPVKEDDELTDDEYRSKISEEIWSE